MNLVVTSENKFLTDGGNAQSNQTMWLVVSSRLIDLSKNATDDHNNDVQNRNNFHQLWKELKYWMQVKQCNTSSNFPYILICNISCWNGN